MVKYIKIGKFAVAYDNTKPAQRLQPETPPPSPPPRPPEHNHIGGSGWAAFGKVMVVIIGMIVLIAIVDWINAPSSPTAAIDPADATSLDPASPQGVCQRADVQALAGKEALRTILDQSRGRIVGLAIFGLVDADAILEQFENASVTFTNARAGQTFANQVTCSGSMRFDASNTNTGQDIIQLPSLTWVVNFADGDGDLTSTNFTIEVDQASVFAGMLVNGKPAAEYLNEQSDEPAQVDSGPATAADISSGGATDAAEAAATDAEQAFREAEQAVRDADAAASQVQPPSDEALNAPQ